MKTISTTVSRRGFMKRSALAGGGLLIGFNLFEACKPTAEPPIDLALLDYSEFNAFIEIAENGAVTIYSPNPEIGQGVKTSMPMIIAEELEVPWDMVLVKQGVLDNVNYTRQVAGGSQSIRHGWDALRNTGATARQMLVNAAAAQWNVEASRCKAEQGVVKHLDSDQELGYGALVNAAAKLDIPEEVSLKSPAEYKIIGKDALNVDLDHIVTGKPLFGLDYKAEGMRIASVKRPPAFGLKLISFDAKQAEGVRGVEQVLQFGDKIAVIAKDTYTAMKAKKMIKAEYEEGTPLESSSDHSAELDKILNGKKFEVKREDGNVEKAFAEADQVIERTYSSPFLPHNCMEPMNFYADVTEDKVHLVGPIQTPAWTANRVAQLLKRKPEDIHLEMTRMGGGFGRRLYGDFALEAAEVSSLAKKPVKVVFSREDDMEDGIYRMAIKYRIKAGIKDGKLTAYHLKEAAVNSNMYDLIPNFFPAGAIENYKVETGNYQSNITTGAWRAPYTNFLASAEQSFFDELAEAMGQDPIEMRMQLLDKVKNNAAANVEYSAERMQKVIEMAVEKSGWGKKEKGIYQGFVNYYCHNTHVAEVADVEVVNGRAELKKITCVVDCGIVINPTGAKNQVEGGVIDGIGHSMYGDFGFDKGAPLANNFDRYRLIRMREAPKVEVHFIENELSPTGLGEPALPPAGGALANALYAVSGKRLYSQPFVDHPEAFIPQSKPLIG